MDLMLLPPCQDNLNFHIDRSCYIANIYSESIRLEMLLDFPSLHGWDVEGNPIWCETYFPDDISDLLLMDNGNESNESDYVESDDNFSYGEDGENYL